MKKINLILFMITVFFSCNKRSAIENIEIVPEVTKADMDFKDVFKKLDGTWKGTFNIYEDQNPVASGAIELENLTVAAVKRAGLKLKSSLKVMQTYTSETPYFQRVQIVDFYPDTYEEMVSKGVNKVQDGKLWCVVKKPNETIVHQGKTKGDNTIIWSSDTKEKKEYFYETVSEQTYEIIGWGYYGNEDRSLSPPLWFYGKYSKQ